MSVTAAQWLTKIRRLPVKQKLRIMNVCGGHERSISMAGMRSALPDFIELIPGPGCPVCVCPEEDVFEAIQMAMHERVILLAFGDMLRVPVNVPKTEARSLLEANARGADVRAIASPMEAVRIAQQHSDRRVVFFAAGFETTTAPIAAMLAEGVPDNLLLLLSARLTWPAVDMLLASDQPGFDCLVAPGHVATVMGADEWRFVAEKYHIPTAVAGFSSESILAAFYSVIRQKLEQRVFLDNCYRELVRAQGNIAARQILRKVMRISDANWRGIGVIARSGFELTDAFAQYDARGQLPKYRAQARKRAGQMPPGCDCAKVVLGKIYPTQCQLYGRACQPRSPIGPCMVSDEGACRIWWSSGRRPQLPAATPSNPSVSTVS